MLIKGERQLSLTPEQTFDGFLDPAILAAAIPGAESVTDEGEGVYHAVVMAAIGPVRARFKGKATMVDVVRPDRLTLKFEGSSGMAGFATGTATVTLSEQDGGTFLAWEAESQIGGRLAQIGSRLIDAAVARMSAQFFDAFEQVMTAPDEVAVPDGDAVAVDARPDGRTQVPVAPVPVAAPVMARAQGGVVLQMPSWAFVASLVTFAALIGWLAAN